MAVFMNAKGTTNTNYQIGKRGGKIFGGVSTPVVADVSTGDVWLDKTNLKTKIALLVDSTSGFNFDSERFVSNSTLSFVDSLMYNSDGSKGYTAGGGTLQQYSLSTAYDWNTRTIDTNESTTSFLDGTGSGIEMSVDGKAVWVMKDNHIYGKTLSTAFDVTTMGSANQTYNFGAESGVGGTAAIKRNRTGDKLYVSVTSGTQDNTIRQYTLADYNDTPNVYTGLSYASKNMSHASQFTSVCRHIEFNDDGTKMYLAAGGDSNIYIYTLSTAHDVSTASYSSTLDFTEASGIYTFTINPAGSKLWISDGSNLRLFNMTGGSQTVTWSEVLTTASVIASVEDLTVSGNLTVEGTTTTIDSTTINVQNSLVFEGSTADDYETTLTTTNPTADRTITIPNASGTLLLGGAVAVEDFTSAAYVTQGETWNSDDSEFATTGRIDQMITSEIANASIMHATGVESFAGQKTFTTGIIVTDITLTDATVTGLKSSSVTEETNLYYTDARVDTRVSNLSTDNLSEGAGNLYYSNPRARAAISVSDNSTAGNELAYNSSTGVISYEGSASGTTNVEKVTALSFGALTDYGLVSGSTTLTSDFGAVSSANVTFSDTGYLQVSSGLPQLPHYTVASLPSTVSAGDLALCTDETGGASVVFNDGTNWRRMADRAIAS